MDAPEYIILPHTPSAQDYHDLRKIANLTPPPMEAVSKALANSFVCFSAFERKDMLDDTTPSPGQHVIAMGRLLGDGALFLQLCDIAVHPDHQRKGLGKRIMKEVINYVDKNAPHAYVSLIAEPLGQKLYSQFGFEDVKPSAGMYRCLRIQNNPEFKRMREAKGEAMIRGTGQRS
ncbi:acyl-CoA N-acyltransferase [Lindgomyces ingoldianus]|uniref:Acyl-CoA N-acyltransferase n=1 Tax=Lindgomyces ingoldianus TaxID=673940 RepID=A0ACB6RCZ3_9PLEO|nr:acyl-CoA N-acyltransferase [Lindgomyces ingoldianus]KAF2476346.1 acyl-CoA N-acyltransferase [Lindgomyces ingoldianus]